MALESPTDMVVAFQLIPTCSGCHQPITGSGGTRHSVPFRYCSRTSLLKMQQQEEVQSARISEDDRDCVSTPSLVSLCGVGESQVQHSIVSHAQ